MKTAFSSSPSVGKAITRVSMEDYKLYVKSVNLPTRLLFILLFAFSIYSLARLFAAEATPPFLLLSAVYAILLWGLLLFISLQATKKALQKFKPEHYELHYHFFEFHAEVYCFDEHKNSIFYLPYAEIELVWNRGDMLYLQFENRIYFIRKQDITENADYIWGCLTTQPRIQRKLRFKKSTALPTPPPPMHPFFGGILSNTEKESKSEGEAPNTTQASYSPFYTPASAPFRPNTDSSTAEDGNKHRALHALGITFFVLSLVLLPIAIALTATITDTAFPEDIPFLLLGYLPFFGIVITSLVLGIVGVSKKVKNLKNIIVACVVGMFLMLFLFIAVSTLTDVTYDAEGITVLEQEFDVDLPDRSSIFTYELYATPGSKISDVTVTEYRQLTKEDSAMMLEQIQEDLRWQEELPVKAIPSSLYFTVREHSGHILYNRTASAYNELQDVSTPQDMVLISYDEQTRTLFVYEYTIALGLVA